MPIRAVFLPRNPESTEFDAVDAVCRAVRSGCILHTRNGQQAFLPPSRHAHLEKHGWQAYTPARSAS